MSFAIVGAAIVVIPRGGIRGGGIPYVVICCGEIRGGEIRGGKIRGGAIHCDAKNGLHL